MDGRKWNALSSEVHLLLDFCIWANVNQLTLIFRCVLAWFTVFWRYFVVYYKVRCIFELRAWIHLIIWRRWFIFWMHRFEQKVAAATQQPFTSKFFFSKKQTNQNQNAFQESGGGENFSWKKTQNVNLLLRRSHQRVLVARDRLRTHTHILAQAHCLKIIKKCVQFLIQHIFTLILVV